MPYASKELIERAIHLGRDRGGIYDTWLYSCADMLGDLAKATPLPDNWCAPVGDAFCGEYRPDDEREAAIEAWRQGALQYYEDGFYLVTLDEIDEICDLARRAPQPEPKPEPRASSALLEAVKRVLPETTGFSSGQTKISYHDFCIIRKAIEAEEARGPSEVYPQFCDSCSDSIYDDEGELIRNPRVEELRKERDEAVARAEKAEAERDLLLVVNAELRHDHDDAIDYMQQADELRQQLAKAEAALAVSTPPQPNHASEVEQLRGVDTGQDDRDDELRRYAGCRSRGQLDGFDWVAADALSELVRRELEGR